MGYLTSTTLTYLDRSARNFACTAENIKRVKFCIDRSAGEVLAFWLKSFFLFLCEFIGRSRGGHPVKKSGRKMMRSRTKKCFRFESCGWKLPQTLIFCGSKIPQDHHFYCRTAKFPVRLTHFTNFQR